MLKVTDTLSELSEAAAGVTLGTPLPKRLKAFTGSEGGTPSEVINQRSAWSKVASHCSSCRSSWSNQSQVAPPTVMAGGMSPTVEFVNEISTRRVSESLKVVEC